YTSADGTFAYDYRFSGMMPAYAAPSHDIPGDNRYSQAIMDELMKTYADKGTFGADTYWGGKGLVQMALNMTFARQTGNWEAYSKSLEKLRDAMTDWLTYTPGENNTFFSYYPRWGAMLGFDVSYDSDAFNDHHFHYGYFTYAAALLCMEDPQFARDYGEILTMIAKDYANWDRSDSRFPFMRTFDPWCGHSWAGGLGDPGNDNGNGQESTSEAMQSWGGLFLLGEALGDTQMRDAGLWGWTTEARATREYWFDVDAPRQANAGGRKPWPGKGDRKGNYDYTQYKYAYNSNITGKGIGWWTWFGGDPLFMHGIQWMPISPALDYLSWDTDFVAWAFDDMMSGANSAYSHQWFTPTTNSDNGESIEPLADNDWGNVALAYMQRAHPEEAAAIFNKAYDEKRHIATSVSTSHISYYLIHHHRTYGDIDFSIYSDCPTASAYLRDGVYTFMVYNPDSSDRKVNFYRNGAIVKTVIAPPNRICAISAEPVASTIEMKSADGLILPPSDHTTIATRLLDQYGAGFTGQADVRFTIDPADAATITSDGKLTVSASAPIGSQFSLKATSGDIASELTFTVYERPATASAFIAPLPEYIESGSEITLKFITVDQYGTSSTPDDTRWEITLDQRKVADTSRFTPSHSGVYTATAHSNNSHASVDFLVTPPMPNLALNGEAVASSEENAGSLTINAIDGDPTSRWGSAHTPDEWLTVDLGEECYLSRAIINWEAAYGADYDLQVAPDGSPVTTVQVNYGGQMKTVIVPQPDSWTTVAEVRGNSSAGAIESKLNTKGRWVRMKGITRGTQYGYSIYEMELFGLPLSIKPDDIIGIDITLPEVATEGTAVPLEAKACTLAGEITPADVTWSANLPARFSADSFIPDSYGHYTITATTPSGFKSQANLFVNESTKLRSIALSTNNIEILQGDEAIIEITGENQFGGIFPIASADITATILDTQGKPVDPSIASFDAQEMLFTANQTGSYSVVIAAHGLSATATVKVLDITEANLALGKPATASSSSGGNTPSKAVDGDPSSRWESDHADNQWLTVDLLNPFIINRVTLIWENAYASDYHLQVSTDGDTWTTVYQTASGKGSTEKIEFGPVPATMVRLCCDRRATNWGNSIMEFEVFGTSRFETPDNQTPPVITELSPKIGNGTVDIEAAANHDSGFLFYKLELTDPSGAVLQTTSTYGRSSERRTASFSGLMNKMDYSVTLTASDFHGNSSQRTINFTGALDITGVNLALGKPVTASSYENVGLKPECAVDGDITTRWGSQFNNDEQIAVDLGNTYSLVNVRIYWDDIAYATDYSVETSCDGVSWQPLFSRSGWAGSTLRASGKLDDYTIPNKTYARHIRLTGHRRATIYGTSVKELEVYGDNDFSQTSGLETVTADPHTQVDVYDIRGIMLRRNVKPDEALKGLPRGLYIVGGDLREAR
ncbi:MAG: discoidin domain-containing protein, partial [Muribaculaceae bacterium]|nr:discoidin domain-containing protein [Muribaculaceae bacterium]